MQMTGLRLVYFFKTEKKPSVIVDMGMSAERLFNNRGTWKSTQHLHVDGQTQALG